MKRWRHALVTGAAKGIGKALAQQLLEKGVRVTLIDKDVINWVDKYDDNLLKIIYTDLINQNSVNDIIIQLDKSRKYDLVIHNAGISATGKFEDIDPEGYENLMRVNVLVPIEMSAIMAQNELYAPNANLVFISSLSHVTGYPGASVYAASKDAIAVYAKSIRKPFSKSGIKVTSVFPAPVKTDHAQRHAPAGARTNDRMEPDILADKILRGTSKNVKSLYPGMKAKIIWIFAMIAPGLVSRLMRKIIFDRLDRPVW